MLACALIGGWILISQDAGKADPPASAALSETEARSLAKYNEQAAKTPNTASAHWKLALWCEQNRLDAEAFVHFARVVELDPKREAAWRKLGFKKQDGRWMTERQIAEEAELKKAEKTWAVELKQWHKEVHSGPRQAEALAALEKLTDPAAVPAIYREFGGGGPNDQRIAIRLLGQIDSPAASKALAVLAIYGKGPSVRQAAIDTLRNRKADDFLAFLVAMMKDPIEYQVKAVGGPGSPGVLLVEGQRFNLQRVYAPPAPNVPFRPGDVITYDNNGMPVVNHSTLISANLGTSGVPGSKTLAVQRQLNEVVTERYSFADAMNEAQKSAVVAQAQLESDVAQVEAINRIRNRWNELVGNVARATTGKDPGPAPRDWRAALKGPAERYRPRPRAKPTVDELVALGYVPHLTPMIDTMSWLSSKVFFDS